MSYRSDRVSFTASLFALAVFAVIAPPGYAQPDAAHIIPGDVALELPNPIPSSRDTDTPRTLALAICGKPSDVQGGAGEISLSVANDGSSGPFIIPILGIADREEEDIAQASVSRLHWTGLEPFPTDCGRWSYTVTLDPDAVQPVSDLILGRAAGSEPPAPFTGSVAVAALFRFSAVDDRRTREVPVFLRLDLAGLWTVAENGGGDSDSNLVLFVEQAVAVLLDPS
jgi:hypothetical protein